MEYTEAIDKLRKAKCEALANSCNIKIGRRELEVALKALEIAKNQLPDMREKIKEYISELDEEIERCIKLVEDKMKELKDSNLIESYTNGVEYVRMESRLQIFTEIKNDLEGRLEELV